MGCSMGCHSNTNVVDPSSSGGHGQTVDPNTNTVLDPAQPGPQPPKPEPQNNDQPQPQPQPQPPTPEPENNDQPQPQPQPQPPKPPNAEPENNDHSQPQPSKPEPVNDDQPQPQPPKPEPEPALKIAVLAVEGLSSVDGVFVEVEIKGQSDSSVKTPTVPVRSRTQGVGEYARESTMAHIKSEVAFKNYTEGADITFSVRDSDPTKTVPLARAVVPAMMIQVQFWGKIPLTLTDAGKGCEVTLEFRVGDRHILVETAQEITNVISDAVEDIGEVVIEAKEGVEVILDETKQNVEQGVDDFSLLELQDAVVLGVGDAHELAHEALVVSKSSLVGHAKEAKEVVIDAWEQTKETDGAVCCTCVL